ncbi:hypothetical protein WJX73_000895 [Symbiochloris irregularis]|uniref:Uncharacterized protein n=1 Tax=Symbiochloris irregularis TaxID=706552 RepID=A0AAW1NXQ9_9CHLO
MASLSNNFQLLNSLQPQKLSANKTGKKGKTGLKGSDSLPTSGPQAATEDRIAANGVDVDVQEALLEGFTLARRSSAKSKSGWQTAKASRSEPESAAVAASRRIEQSLKGSATADDWLSLWRGWLLQIQAQQSAAGCSGLDFRKALLGSSALEKSAIACLTLDRSAVLGPFTDLLTAAASINHLASAANSKLNLREQLKVAQSMRSACQERLKLLAHGQRTGSASQQAVAALDGYAEKLEAHRQGLQASQQAQAASLQERQVLLSEEQLALEADIEELKRRLSQLEDRLCHVRKEHAEVIDRQGKPLENAAELEACARGLEAAQGIQVLVASSSTLPDAACADPAPGPIADAGRAMITASLQELQLSLQWGSQLLGKATFACQSMARTKQQLGHFHSQRADAEVTKALQRIAKLQAELQAVGQESQQLLASCLASGKAALVQTTTQPQDAAAPSGQALEDLMRQAEDQHAQLVALKQDAELPLTFPIHSSASKGSKTAGINGSAHAENGHNILSSADTISSDGASATPSIAASSLEVDTQHLTNGSGSDVASKDGSQARLSKNARRKARARAGQ